MSTFHYCLNSSTIRPAPLLEKIRIAGTVGYAAIELWNDDLDAHLQAGGSLGEVRQARAVDGPQGVYYPHLTEHAKDRGET